MMTKDKIVIASELDMKFDEAMELFSDETLNTMRMGNVVGGGEEEDPGVNFSCPKNICPHIGNCGGCQTDCPKDSCPGAKIGFCEKGVICETTIAIPIPSLIAPSAPPLNTIIP